jgi:hypothetical protein
MDTSLATTVNEMFYTPIKDQTVIHKGKRVQQI